MMEMIKEFFNDESGASIVEYAILVAMIAVAVIIVITSLGTVIKAEFQDICTRLNDNNPCTQ